MLKTFVPILVDHFFPVMKSYILPLIDFYYFLAALDLV
jgi:hypothetical protein